MGQGPGARVGRIVRRLVGRFIVVAFVGGCPPRSSTDWLIDYLIEQQDIMFRSAGAPPPPPSHVTFLATRCGRCVSSTSCLTSLKRGLPRATLAQSRTSSRCCPIPSPCALPDVPLPLARPLPLPAPISSRFALASPAALPHPRFHPLPQSQPQTVPHPYSPRSASHPSSSLRR